MQTVIGIVAALADLSLVVAILASVAALMIRPLRRTAVWTLRVFIVLTGVQVWLNCTLIVVSQWSSLGLVLAVPFVFLLVPVALIVALYHHAWGMAIGVFGDLLLIWAARAMSGYFQEHPYRQKTREPDTMAASAT